MWTKPSKKWLIPIFSFSASVAALPLLTACGAATENASIVIDPTPRNRALTLTGDQKNQITTVLGQGSSSVVPIINSLKSVLTSMQYLPSGSGAGYRAMVQSPLTNDFGMTSSLRYPKTDAELATWKQNQIRTVTFARDAIGIVVHLPSGLTPSGRPQINLTALARLYDDNPSNNPSWTELIANLPAGASASTPPRPQGRNGGAEASGTSDAFWSTLKKYVPKDAKPDLNHEHLPQTQLTGEANTLASDVANATIGAITYLSLGFAVQNEATSNYQLATLVGENINWEPVALKDNKPIVNINNYGWKRNFNVLYPANNATARLFTQYLLSDAGQAFSELAGFVPLATTPFETRNEITQQAGTDASDLALSDAAYLQKTQNLDDAAADAAIKAGKVGL